VQRQLLVWGVEPDNEGSTSWLEQPLLSYDLIQKYALACRSLSVRPEFSTSVLSGREGEQPCTC